MKEVKSKDSKLNLVLLGAPGAGKGTQARLLCDAINIQHISTGDIFRKHIAGNTELGIQVKEYLDNGLLVPDSVTIEIVKLRLSECKQGFVLDGFPRTVLQAQALDELVNIDSVINISVSIDKLASRLALRRVCHCGKTFTAPNLDVKSIQCVCGGKAVQREDDKQAIVKRISVYQSDTAPLIEFYQKQGKLFTVDGMQSIELVHQSLYSKLFG
ncbi:MAG: adenylate kinase [Clostridiales bacterium]|jgi:adenylate kinase|nr:adenylate kinase [Clostridiales bacterium]